MMGDAFSFSELNSDVERDCFRTAVHRRLEEVLPRDIRQAAEHDFPRLSGEQRRRWQRILDGLGGWSCPNWPTEHGGPGWSLRQQYIFERELALVGAPRLMVLGQGMLGPALMEFGSVDQQQRFLPAIRNGDILLCQGYSEPNAGSDLAALNSSAKRDGDSYVVNGSKIWTTNAHIADLMFGLFRTGTEGRRQSGITMLLIDMRSAGISVTPIVTIDGEHEVNQVFFDNVVVPAANRLGDENDGWRIGKIILGYERFGSAETSRCLSSLNRVKAHLFAAGRHPPTASQLREFARLEIELHALIQAEESILFDEQSDPHRADLGPALLKILGSDLQQRIFALSVASLGHLAQVDFEAAPEGDCGQIDEDLAISARTAVTAMLNSRKLSIYSGANEVLTNSIARVLLR